MMNKIFLGATMGVWGSAVCLSLFWPGGGVAPFLPGNTSLACLCMDFLLLHKPEAISASL